MIEEHELHLIIPGITKVICPQKHHNYAAGWNTLMDDMINKPLIVQKIINNLICLNHPHGNQFNFNIKILNLYNDSIFSKITFRNVNLLCEPYLDMSFFNYNCNIVDYNIIKKIFKNKKSIEISEHSLETLYKHCPRVLGVLLSNNKLQLQDA